MKRILLSLIAAVFVVGCAGPSTTNPGSGGVNAVGSQYPYAKPVPEKAGYVFSPFTENTVHVDVKGFPRGTQVKDPFTGKIFLVP